LFAALALVALVAGAGTAASACSGEECVGGILIDGECQAECEQDKCREGNTCVNNQCMLMCDSHQDCYTDIQDCAPAQEDGTGAAIFVCSASTKLIGFGHGCPFGVECGDFGACPDGGRCSLIACNNAPEACARDEAICGSDESCSIGKCTDGNGCTASACAKEQCSLPLTCLTAGEGDAEAYCTQHGCQADTDCPAGYYCGVTRDPREICGTNKGNSNFCGTTLSACVDPAQLAEQGLFEGSLCALRNTCLKRAQCAPCATDLDCSYGQGQRCVPLGGGNICARACETDGDCDPDHACNSGACIPRFQACTGQGNFCEPCLSDADCGGPETTMGCASLSGGMRACFDFSFPNTCTTDADCPAAPSGRRGSCLDEDQGVPQGDPLYHRCYLPYNAADNKTSCW
jgi:hypothetical protein